MDKEKLSKNTLMNKEINYLELPVASPHWPKSENVVLTYCIKSLDGFTMCVKVIAK